MKRARYFYHALDHVYFCGEGQVRPLQKTFDVVPPPQLFSRASSVAILFMRFGFA